MSLRLSLLLISALLCVAAADKVDPRKGGGPDVERRINYFQRTHSVLLKASSAVPSVVTRYEFEFTTNGLVRWRSRFFATNNGGTSSYTHRVALVKVVEYNDTGSTAGQFDSGDLVTNSIRVSTFSSGAWSNVRHWSTVGIDGNTTVHHWNTFLSPFQGAGSALNITFHTGERIVWDNSTAVTVNPKGIKFDLGLENYQPVTACQGVAIVLAVTSQSIGTVESLDSTTGAVPVGSQGGLTWTNQISIGSSPSNLQPSTITVSGILPPTGDEANAGTGNDHSGNGGDFGDDDDASENSQVVYFSVPVTPNAPLYVSWDPTFTVDTTSDASTVVGSFFVWAFAAAVAMIASNVA